ncbi:MAG TPA: hypothetical protein VFE57_08735, partial [Cyclobacteriaceae bacterium]|nr:hypothetical protein [Cyclobacteriaceae bacterium]
SEKNYFGGVTPTGKYIKKDTTYKSKTNFNNGNFVLFVTSQLNERTSVLSELSFNNTGKTFNFEVQRLLVRYYVKDYFSVRVGKMFTPIGYWNNQFTLGLVLQPTIQRPQAIRPVSEGGVLQYRDAGVQFEGDNITSARLFYRVMVGNGIGYYGSNDKSDKHVAATGQIGTEPVDGLKILASAMFDRIEKGKSNPNGSISSLPNNGNLNLLVASAAYMNPEKKVEFIGEFLHQTSNFDNLGKTSSHSWYVYGGYKITNKITPYALFNYTQAGKSTTEADPYFSPLPVKINQLNLGVRYKFNSNFICKLEYEINNSQYFYQNIMVGTTKLDDGFTNTAKSNKIRLQLAFAF